MVILITQGESVFSDKTVNSNNPKGRVPRALPVGEWEFVPRASSIIYVLERVPRVMPVGIHKVIYTRCIQRKKRICEEGVYDIAELMLYEKDQQISGKEEQMKKKLILWSLVLALVILPLTVGAQPTAAPSPIPMPWNEWPITKMRPSSGAGQKL